MIIGIMLIKNISDLQIVCQTVRIKIRSDFLSTLIWVIYVSNCYQQMVNVVLSRPRVEAPSEFKLVAQHICLLEQSVIGLHF